MVPVQTLPWRRCWLISLGLVAALLLGPFLALGLGQSGTGFNETAGESITVRDASWNLRTSMAFAVGETIHVNVTSALVDWLGNAGGGGRRDLILLDYKGTTLTTTIFWQYAPGTPGPSRYLGNLTLSGLLPDWYYVRIRLDDTRQRFEARLGIVVGSPVAPHSIKTYTDSTFSQESQVFTTDSTVWVRIVADTNGDPDVWDIYDYQVRSAVGGPRGGFSSFRRDINVYTFSIDLSSFPGAFAQAWSYTLDVSLRPGIFNAGTQIEVYNPNLAIASLSLAPATAFQGQTAVPLLKLSLSLDPSWSTTHAPAAFNLERLRITRLGTAGADADIAGVRVYQDVNNNGLVDSGDILLASRSALGGLTFPIWVGTAGTTMAYLIPGQTLNLLIAYDVAPNAGVGDLQGARLAAPADVGVHGTFASIAGLPASSSNFQVAGATVITLTGTRAAPGFVTPGQTLISMNLLTLRSNGPTVVLTSLSLTLGGSGVPGDVAAVRLYRDDGDGLFQPGTKDPLLAGPLAFPPSGPLFIGGLSLAIPSGGVSLWVAYDISATAPLGHSVEALVATNTSAAISSGWIFDQGFPMRSGVAAIQGPTVLVSPTDVAATVAALQVKQGTRNQVFLALNLSMSSGQATLTALRVDRLGSASDLDIPRAKLWMDVNGNGLWDLGDTLLASSPFVGGTATFTGLNVTVAYLGYRLLFLAVDVAPTGTLGASLSLRLRDASYLSVLAPAAVDGGPFGISSTALTLVAAGAPMATLTMTGVDLVPQRTTAQPGDQRVLLLRLTLIVDANTATVSGLRIDRKGTADDRSVLFISLWQDSNHNGVVDAADLLLGNAVFRNGVAVYNGLNIPVAAGSPVDLLITVDIHPGASGGTTLGVVATSVDSLALQPPASVNPATLPAASGLLSITVPEGLINGTTLLLVALLIVGTVATLAFFILLGRRRHRCASCGKPVPPDRRICDECAAAGRGPAAGPGGGAAPP